MALRKNLAHRFLSLCRPSTAGSLPGRPKSGANRSFLYMLLNSPAPSERGFLRRMLLQSRSIGDSRSSSSVPMERLSLPVGEKLIEKLRAINGGRIMLDVIHDPPRPAPPDRKWEPPAEQAPAMSVEEMKKVPMLSRTEAVNAWLRATGKSSISYSEVLQICCEGSSHCEQGLGLASAVDDFGAVLVHGCRLQCVGHGRTGPEGILVHRVEVPEVKDRARRRFRGRAYTKKGHGLLRRSMPRRRRSRQDRTFLYCCSPLAVSSFVC